MTGLSIRKSLAAPVKNEEGHAEAEPDADKDQFLLRGLQDVIDDVQAWKKFQSKFVFNLNHFKSNSNTSN